MNNLHGEAIESISSNGPETVFENFRSPYAENLGRGAVRVSGYARDVDTAFEHVEAREQDYDPRMSTPTGDPGDPLPPDEPDPDPDEHFALESLRF